MQDKILSIDFGLRRVGIAVSDALGLLAHDREPLRYKSTRELLQQICTAVAAENVAKIVVGLPLHMDGSEGEMAAHVRRFQAQLAEKVTVPIVLWDERFTSVQAERLLIERGVTFSRNKGEVDRLAAVFILQSYLDHLAMHRNSDNQSG
jgi:putative Holliday junction resolvase